MDPLRGEFDSAWAQFQTLGSLRLVPDTLESEWRQGRDTYLAFLTPVSDPAALSHLRAVVQELEGIPGVEPYPEGYWHITLKGIGFEGSGPAHPEIVSASELGTIADAARLVFADQPVFSVSIGLANAFPEVVFAEVCAGLPIRDLNSRLLEAIPGLVRYPFDGPNFLPHISLARFTSNDGLAQLKETISRLRDGAAGPAFPVREVHFIRARLSEQVPTFENIESYPLTADH
jgi:2'-5' RNA ligase